MDIAAKFEQVRCISRASPAPVPLILDLLRMKRSDYRAQCDGLLFELQAGCHEWFTIYENVIRGDYFSDGITVAAGDTVIDIGANFGSFALLAARKAGPTGRVIAFEPNPDVCARLARNVAMNGLGNIAVRNEAVSGADGELVLLLQKRSAFTTAYAGIDERVSEGTRRVSVKATAIRTILASLDVPVALMKVDCEGAEYDIFDALDAASLAKVRQITMELHAIAGRSGSAIADKLAGCGYIVHNAYPKLTAVRA